MAISPRPAATLDTDNISHVIAEQFLLDVWKSIINPWYRTTSPSSLTFIADTSSLRNGVDVSHRWQAFRCSAAKELVRVLEGSLEEPFEECKRWNILCKLMLHAAWHAGHHTYRPRYLLCPSLGTPCDCLIHINEQRFLACGTECFTASILYYLHGCFTLPYSTACSFENTCLGSALSSVWRQTDITASLWTTAGVTAYLAGMSVLHVTSSTLLQFQPFNTSMTTSVPTTLGWLNDLSFHSDANWGSITASLPVINQLPGMVTPGLSNTTLYDTLKTISVGGNATVNATTISSHCGLLPNVTYSSNISMASAPFSMYGANYSLVMGANPLWSDQIQVLQFNGFAEFSGGRPLPDGIVMLPNVLLMVSTSLGIEPSVQEAVAVNIAWDYPNMSNPTNIGGEFDIQVYFMQCSLLANTADALVDMQTNSLMNPVPISQPSTQWEIYQWTNVSGWAAEIGNALSTPVSSGYSFGDPSLHPTQPSIVDEYIMSLVGLNLTAEELQYGPTSAPTISTFVLKPDILELAVAKAAAQLIWIAGQIGTSNGGFQPGDGMAYVDEVFIALRLNINLLPLCFAVSASVIMLGLALRMTRAFHASHDSQAAIPNIGVLQLLWLGHRSASINEVLEDVEHPTEANLRRAGMIDVCFGKTVSNEEELGSPSASDSLSREVDHLHDDVM